MISLSPDDDEDDEDDIGTLVSADGRRLPPRPGAADGR
jgi:hypothetical protein